jgi:p-hydroxybenzoate 3-monooxygenase
MRTQVAIIGGGPSGMLLSRLLFSNGIESVVLERQDKATVLSRIRAGVLEPGTVALLERAGAADRLHREGFKHGGTLIWDGQVSFRVDFGKAGGGPVTVYGQTEVTRDLYAQHEALGGKIHFNVRDVALHDVNGLAPHATFASDTESDCRLDADFIVGCDGFHGVSRKAIPQAVRRDYESVLPVSWVGVLSRTPPAHSELIYGTSDHGFALCSLRRNDLSRYYLQCAVTDTISDWSDETFWAELKRRIPPELADQMVTGPSIETSVIPLRSFVTEPMQWGRLFLCGDAAHIFPPTGAKGLNAAARDVGDLSAGLVRFYLSGDRAGLDAYSDAALARVWRMQRFSLWFTRLLHRMPDETPHEARLRAAELHLLRDSTSARKVMAESYVGLNT